MFRNVSIQTKLPAGYGLALIIIVLLGVFALYQLGTLNRFMAEMTGSWLPEIESLTEIKRGATSHRLLAERRTETRSFRELAEITTEMEAAAATVQTRRLTSSGEPQMTRRSWTLSIRSSRTGKITNGRSMRWPSASISESSEDAQAAPRRNLFDLRSRNR